MYHFGEQGGGWMMMFWWIFIIPLLLIFVWWAVTAMGTTKNRKTSDPLDTLKDRYARGEIDKEEFESKKKALSD